MFKIQISGDVLGFAMQRLSLLKYCGDGASGCRCEFGMGSANESVQVLFCISPHRDLRTRKSPPGFPVLRPTLLFKPVEHIQKDAIAEQ